MNTTINNQTPIKYQYDPITIAAYDRLRVTSPKTISEQSHTIGLQNGEPIIVAMDALIKYAKAHKAAYFSPLSEDYVLGDPWLEAVKGIRSLCNGNGAVAMFMDRSQDSKDNGTIESMFWTALEIAGYDEKTANL